jgi:hypothetical protein
MDSVLRDDAEAKQRAPAGKVLVRQDEMGEFFANLDRYRAGGKGGGDRGAYLRLYNGGRHVLDRVGRGAFAASNWSACFLGGIQPGPVRRIAREADDDGLPQRFMFCVPGAQGEGEDRVPDAEALARYDALFPALVGLRPAAAGPGGAPRPVVLHADAHRHREAVGKLARAMAAMPDASPRLKASFGKWPGLFARLALAFHLIDVADARARGTEGPYHMVATEEAARRFGPSAPMMPSRRPPRHLRTRAIRAPSRPTRPAWAGKSRSLASPSRTGSTASA